MEMLLLTEIGMSNRKDILAHEFVEFIPSDIKEGVLYISMPYATAAHKCCCGCGQEVVTPFSPTDWKLTFDGRSVSLNPSIGNWSFDCKSHYWIRSGQIAWAESWSQNQINSNRAYDHLAKAKQTSNSAEYSSHQKLKSQEIEQEQKSGGFWKKLRSIFLTKN